MISLPFVHYLKNEIKKEVKIIILQNKLSHTDLVQFSEKDLKNASFIDKNEFLLKGEMFDIVTSKVIKGRKIYYCFLDKKETKIAVLETKIHNFFSISNLKQIKGKTYVLNSPKTGKFSENIKIFAISYYQDLEKRSQYRSYNFYRKSSDYVKKAVIPPEV